METKIKAETLKDKKYRKAGTNQKETEMDRKAETIYKYRST